METRAHYAIVGGVALLLLAGTVLFVLWLGQLSYRQELSEYDIVFEGPVRGVSESSEVRFNGIKVGDITRLGLDPSNPNNVIARVRIDALTPVKTDSIAQIEPQGITGVSYIQLTGGSPEAPLLRDDGRGPPPIIYAKEGPLEGFVANAEDVMNEAEAALQRLQVLLNDENLERANETLENIRLISADLKDNTAVIADIRGAVENISAAADELARATASVQGLIEDDAGPAIRSWGETAESTTEAVQEIRAFAENANDMLARFNGEESSDLGLLITDLRSLTQSLELVITDLQDDPSSLLSGSSQQKVEIPR